MPGYFNALCELKLTLEYLNPELKINFNFKFFRTKIHLISFIKYYIIALFFEKLNYRKKI